MLSDTIIEDGQEIAVSREQAEHLGSKRLICQCPPCGPTIWHFRDEDVTFEEVTAELKAAYGLAEVNSTQRVEAAADIQRLDWLEQAYTDGAKDPKSWREFMTRVAEVGFRKAIDGAKAEEMAARNHLSDSDVYSLLGDAVYLKGLGQTESSRRYFELAERISLSLGDKQLAESVAVVAERELGEPTERVRGREGRPG